MEISYVKNVSDLFLEVPLQVYTKVFQKTLTLDILNMVFGEVKFKCSSLGEYTEISFQILWMLYIEKYFIENKGCIDNDEIG